MLSGQTPTLLVVLGTVLMAVVIFAPVRAATPVTISYAPPVASPRDAWDVAVDEPVRAATAGAEPCGADWPAMIDPGAVACDVAARLSIVDALEAVRSPWAHGVLARALHDDPSVTVRHAAAAAIGTIGDPM